MRLVLAIDEATIRSADAWTARLESTASAGFDAIELPAEATPQQISQAAQRGLGMIVVRSPCGLLERRAGSYHGFSEPAVADLIATLDRTAEQGGALVTVRPAGVTVEGADPPIACYEDALWATHDALTGLRDPAERVGVVVGVEAAADGFLLSPVELRDLLDRVNSPYITTCLDLDGISRIGRPLDWIRTLRHRIGCVRLGQGQQPALDQTVAALREVMYTGPVVCGGEPLEAARRLSRFGLETGGV